MATSKAKRPILLAQPNPEQILRPKRGLRISPADSYPRTRTPRVPGTPADARKPAQPQRRSLNPKTNADPAGLTPVKANVYRAMAELNGGFQTVIHELQVLAQVCFLRPHGVTEMRDLICRLRAQANRDFTMAMHEREKTNADVLAGTP
jgi:hypothetical protein